MLAISAQTFYADEEEENYGFEPDNQDRLASQIEPPLTGFSSYFDPRNDYATLTKYQGFLPLCWMYAATGAVEQYASKKYGSKFDVSARHGAVALSNSIIQTPGSDPTEYYSNYYAHGGFAGKALQYFTNWNEPIFYNNSTHWKSSVLDKSFQDTDPSNINSNDSTFQSAESILNVTGAMYLSNDSSTIKSAIINYGGVIASIRYDPELVSRNGIGNKAFYNSTTINQPNHSIVIVGWDDNYSVDNFNMPGHTPQNNGAWLIRNSYSNDNSYFRLSYEEGSLYHTSSNKVAITGVQKSDKSEKMLSYDYKFIGNGSVNSTNQTLYFCNVYNTSDYSNNYNEITKVMMYLKSTGCAYQIKVIPLSDEDNLPTNIDNYSVLATGNCNFEGYITEELDYPVDITNVDKCAIIIKLTPSSSDSIIYYPYEVPTSQFHVNESFLGIESNNSISWNDCKTDVPYINGNLCIRPVLHNSNYVADDVTISPTQVVPTNSDVEIQVSSINKLFCIHTPSNHYLREGIDYTRDTEDNVIKLKHGFLNALYGNYTPLVFEFNDDITKTIYVNPSAINNVQIVGQPIVGETLTAQLSGQPALTSYDVDYQWEYFDDTENEWAPISGATQSSYIINETYFNKYLRVAVTPQPNGNVITGNTSNSTSYQAVVLGDCNLDGCVDSFDALQIQKYSAGRVHFDGRQLLAADFNKDGVVDSLDSSAILYYLNN